MSIKSAKAKFERYRRVERAEMKELFSVLPDKSTDRVDCVLIWPIAKGWSQTIEDALTDSGYDIEFDMLSKSFLISFSDAVQKKIMEKISLESREKKKAKIGQ